MSRKPIRAALKTEKLSPKSFHLVELVVFCFFKKLADSNKKRSIDKSRVAVNFVLIKAEAKNINE